MHSASVHRRERSHVALAVSLRHRDICSGYFPLALSRSRRAVAFASDPEASSEVRAGCNRVHNVTGDRAEVLFGLVFLVSSDCLLSTDALPLASVHDGSSGSSESATARAESPSTNLTHVQHLQFYQRVSSHASLVFPGVQSVSAGMTAAHKRLQRHDFFQHSRVRL